MFQYSTTNQREYENLLNIQLIIEFGNTKLKR